MLTPQSSQSMADWFWPATGRAGVLPLSCKIEKLDKGRAKKHAKTHSISGSVIITN